MIYVVYYLNNMYVKLISISNDKETSRNPQKFEPMKIKKQYGTAISITQH